MPYLFPQLYQEAPLPADSMNNAYGGFTIAYLGLGIFRPLPYTPEGSKVSYPAYLYNLSFFGLAGRHTAAVAAATPSLPKEVPTTVYEVRIRGACKLSSVFLFHACVCVRWLHVRKTVKNGGVEGREEREV